MKQYPNSLLMKPLKLILAGAVFLLIMLFPLLTNNYSTPNYLKQSSTVIQFADENDLNTPYHPVTNELQFCGGGSLPPVGMPFAFYQRTPSHTCSPIRYFDPLMFAVDLLIYLIFVFSVKKVYNFSKSKRNTLDKVKKV